MMRLSKRGREGISLCIILLSGCSGSPEPVDAIPNDAKGDVQLLDSEDVAAPSCESSGVALALALAPPGPVPAGGPVAVGDFDGDGVTDLVICQANSGSSIFRNSGQGTFLPWGNGCGGGGVGAVIGADIDGDGTSELLIDQHNLTVYRPVEGSYAAIEQTIKLGPNSLLNGPLAFADLDGAGRPELIGVSVSSSSAYVFKQDATGKFSEFWHESGPFAATGTGFALSDINGDGLLDLAVGNMLRLGNGDATFQQGFLIPAVGYCTALVALDVSGDGVDDLICSDKHPEATSEPLTWLVTTDGAAGVLVAPLDLPAPGTVPRLATDLDGDGKDELVCSGVAGVAVIRTKGAMTLELVNLALVVRTASSEILALDANGDGHGDLAVFSAGPPAGVDFAPKLDDHFLLLLGDGTGHFMPMRSPAVPRQVLTLTAEDLDGDGLDDLVAGVTEGSLGAGGAVDVLLSRGDGTFELPSAYRPETAYAPEGFAVADVTGDGIKDIVVANIYQGGDPARACGESGPMPPHLIIGHGAGAFAPAVPLAAPGGSAATSVAVADVDGDGDTDIVAGFRNEDGVWILDIESPKICNGTSRYVTYLNDGGGAFKMLEPFVPEIAPAGQATGCGIDLRTPLAIDLADMTGDDVPDLVVAYSVYAVYPVPCRSSECCAGLCGPTEMSKEVASGVFVAKGDGKGHFDDVADLLATGAQGSPTAGDFDGDGLTDLVSAGGGDLTTYRGLGTDPTADPLWVTATPSTCYCPNDRVDCPPEPPHLVEKVAYQSQHWSPVRAMAAGRLDGDQCDDLALLSNFELNPKLVVYRATSPLAFQEVAVFEQLRGASAVTMGDFDGDGRRDIAAAVGGGLIAVYLNVTPKE